jgi:uncharacterized protein (TIGR02231 family)
MEDMFVEAEEAPEPTPIAAEVIQAEIDSSGAAITFRISHKVDIPADNTPHETTVLTLHLVPDLDFLTIPKLSEEVYRRAEVTNSSEVTLLPGPVTLFHGGDFVGSASIPQVAPGETFETTLGIEDRIKVERKLALKEVSKQFIGDRRSRRYAYEIEIQNLLPASVKIEVGDQFPIAAHENIKIKLEEIAPQTDTEDELGELTWELELEPQEKRTLRFGFSISAPRSDTLIGLP